MKKPVTFDIRQHLGEWYRHFLPIATLVAAAFLMIWLLGSRLEENRVENLPEVTGAPVGLVPPDGEGAFDPAFFVLSPIEMVSAPVTTRWDWPLGGRNGALAYNAQAFLTNNHLGDDFNGIGGWNSDLGDPVYASADGVVVFSGWPADGWGNVVILLHEMPDGELVESFYGHLDSIHVPVGARVRRGETVGTVGNAAGVYLAHLHFEIRRSPVLAVGGGYAGSQLDRMSGERFLQKRRNRELDELAGPPVAGESTGIGPGMGFEFEVEPVPGG